MEGRPGRARHPGGVAPARGPQGVQGGELGAENPAGDATYGLRGHRSPPAVEGRRPRRAVTGPAAAPTLTLRSLGSRARPPEPPGRLPRPQRRKQPPALLAALLSCSHLCARTPPPPPEGRLPLPRLPRVCQVPGRRGGGRGRGGRSLRSGWGRGRGMGWGGHRARAEPEGAVGRGGGAAGMRQPGGSAQQLTAQCLSFVLDSGGVDRLPDYSSALLINTKTPGICADFYPQITNEKIEAPKGQVIDREITVSKPCRFLSPRL